jgi:hypothetical protein
MHILSSIMSLCYILLSVYSSGDNFLLLCFSLVNVILNLVFLNVFPLMLFALVLHAYILFRTHTSVVHVYNHFTFVIFFY